MRIYSINGTSGYELCHPVDQNDFEAIYTAVNGELRAVAWKPVVMKIIRVDEGRALTESDAPWLGSHALMFRPRACDALAQLLSQNGELLPVDCDGASLCMFNATHVLEALDEDASQLRRFENGKIMRVSRHVFRPDVIGATDMFKIRNMRVSPTFVTQRFVDAWRDAGLQGLDFTPIWAPN